MPTIGVYFSEMEYMNMVSHISNQDVKISEYIRKVVIMDMEKSTPVNHREQSPIIEAS